VKHLLFIPVLAIFIGCGDTPDFVSIDHSKREHIRVATYNVENLFDLTYNGSEYLEYIPDSPTNWNKENYQKKIENISKVIRDIDPDIIGLEEIESKEALLDLKENLGTYKYFAIADEKLKKSGKASVTMALLSKFPIESISEVKVTNHPMNRNILEVVVKVGKEPLHIFVNHWKAKSGPETKRIRSAEYLKERLDKLSDSTPYILLGDFNSNYNEYITFQNSKNLNDSDGKTGINHTLGTVKDAGGWFSSKYEFVSKGVAQNQRGNDLHYSLWLELPEDDRWSYKYNKKKDTLDSMIISKGLLDSTGLEYVDGTFKVYREGGVLDSKGNVFRWKKDSKKRHLGEGFSDHLPIYADFSY
jgi:endonuclease/exonuclease/phosphatase family metal-dependent hydrolase